ncbi:MAG: hypothetical protein EPN25_05020 [Nitrospirae bacterium]|nr:MAG: hypothetical protein EPN25_05020 [Nitrospirota bacterium]
MKIHYRAIIVAMLMAIFLAGCGCGGDNRDLVSIAVSPADPSILQGAVQQFAATGTFSDGTSEDITTLVTWTSSAASVAVISNDTGSQGRATSVQSGITTITATQGSISGGTTLTVVPVLVSISVTPANPTVTVGDTKQFTATGTFSDGSTSNITTTVTWSSSVTAAASVSNTAGVQGLATGLAAGTTTITATSGALSGSTGLTVINPVFLVSITVTPVNPYATFASTVQFTATGTYSDGSTQNITQVVTWTSSDLTIATISNDAGSKGLATTDHKVGVTTITATLGSISGSTKLFDP